MKIRTLILAAFLALSSAAFGQQVGPGGWSWGGSISTSGSDCSVATNCLSLPLYQSVGSGTITLSGTFTGTVQFEASGDGGTTWSSVAGLNGTSSATSATAAGTWQFSLGGYTNIRARASALAAGIVNVAINTSTGGGGLATSITLPGGATITGTTGNVAIAAAGTNQNIVLTPSGTGTVQIPNGGLTITGSTVSPTFASTGLISNLTLGSNATINNFNLYNTGNISFHNNIVAYSATPTFALGAHQGFKITLTGNVTSSTATFVGAIADAPMVAIVCQDAVGGHSFAWPSNLLGGMTISGATNTTASKCDAQMFWYDNATGNAYAVSSGVGNM